ncbi:hypothetical protein FAM18172_01164 [Lacticaseibacillus paracasei]|uniref:Uncharacterized protein n=1 Tax=Lacticaseibacillus paracasei TaxID=1597 RepID=A0A422MC82_LACPA|nr:hypothetical protein FAM18172_01164 [Lacticaseibacillus paracasei]
MSKSKDVDAYLQGELCAKAESGRGSISLNTLDKIAYGAGIDPWELIRPPESK